MFQGSSSLPACNPHSTPFWSPTGLGVTHRTCLGMSGSGSMNILARLRCDTAYACLETMNISKVT